MRSNANACRIANALCRNRRWLPLPGLPSPCHSLLRLLRRYLLRRRLIPQRMCRTTFPCHAAPWHLPLPGLPSPCRSLPRLCRHSKSRCLLFARQVCYRTLRRQAVLWHLSLPLKDYFPCNRWSFSHLPRYRLSRQPFFRSVIRHMSPHFTPPLPLSVSSTMFQGWCNSPGMIHELRS
jgi:hypothetical protein